MVKYVCISGFISYRQIRFLSGDLITEEIFNALPQSEQRNFRPDNSDKPFQQQIAENIAWDKKMEENED